MSFGKMNLSIEIVSAVPVRDAEGYMTRGDRVLAHVRAYREERHGSERWANRATFSQANALFRFRRIPGLEISPDLEILCLDGRYRILGVERIGGLYIEVLAGKVVPSG